jgi:ketopantoate reductase
MRICIFGAGAIGGYLGAKLADAGAEVSLVARGPHLAAMQARGLTLTGDGAEVTVPVRASDDPASLGPQDYVIVTLKAHAVPGQVGPIRALLGPDTTLVSAVNGVPWWYFHRLGGPLEGTRLASVDPGDAEPTRAAARGFIGPRCATKSLRGCFTASASSACRSLNGRRHTVGVARGRAHVLRQATLSARRRPRERGRTCAVVGPSDSFSDNQNWPERISSLT